ncbi:beta-lactamase family protein [Ilyomonas limi]|uniref:Beta-lactamase family protein n=1 Tax=Ilyomonas limi TaxID=2575867 RepID=A0A4U3L8I1_9BACT|nr:serine hydrolase domain-containing protein [Ilyomonas limi]TKK70754.1 beta-lactamase family protein [Ilyomonas limi]
MKKLSCLLLLTATYLLSAAQTLQTAAPSAANFSDERLQRIDKVMQQAVDSGWIAGCVAFIARNGKIVYNKGFGYADVESKTKMQPDNIFRIASQTKAITSVAVMMLYEEGKFLLDDPVSKYIPAFANARVLYEFTEKDSTFTTVPAKREVTIRDLLTHTSGIDYALIGSPQMKAIYAKAGLNPAFGSDTMKLVNMVNKLATLPLGHQPGEKWTYGLNVDVLGRLVEIASGMPLDQFFQQRIFQPLGMNDTYFYLPENKYNRLVTAYTEDKQHKRVTWESQKTSIGTSNYPKIHGTYFAGGAGLSSTVRDYATFLQMLLNGGIYNGHRLLAPRTIELITSNQIGDLNLGVDKFGLGFEIVTAAGQAQAAWSQGSFAWGGFFGTTYWADPKKNIVCEIYMQQTPLTHWEISNKFKALVYQALMD